MVLDGDDEVERINDRGREPLGASAATFTQHLRNAELQLFESVLEGRSATA